ncbi:14291_t:CDS:1, partial [Gigaspora margarita]
SSSLQKNIKAMNADLKNTMENNNSKMKSFAFKKDMLPKDL